MSLSINKSNHAVFHSIFPSPRSLVSRWVILQYSYHFIIFAIFFGWLLPQTVLDARTASLAAFAGCYCCYSFAGLSSSCLDTCTRTRCKSSTASVAVFGSFCVSVHVPESAHVRVGVAASIHFVVNTMSKLCPSQYSVTTRH